MCEFCSRFDLPPLIYYHFNLKTDAQAELLSTLTFGVDRIFQKGSAGANERLSDADIDAIIRRDRVAGAAVSAVSSSVASADGAAAATGAGLPLAAGVDAPAHADEGADEGSDEGSDEGASSLMKQQRTSVNDFDETTKFKSLYELQGVDFSKVSFLIFLYVPLTCHANPAHNLTR